MRTSPVLVIASTLILTTACTSGTQKTSASVTPSRSQSASMAQRTETATATPAPTLDTATGSAAASSASTASSANIAGGWDGTYQSTKFPKVAGTFHVTFTQAGATISGTVRIDSSDCVSDGTVNGNVSRDKISFGAVKAQEIITFSGTISSTSMSGQYHSGVTCGNDSGTWAATRA